MSNKFIADNFRYLSNLHTTVRQLFILSKITSLVDKEFSHLELIEMQLMEWSISISNTMENYSSLRGTLYKNGKQSTALKHYMKLLLEFGLIQNLNEVYYCTKLGSIFKYFLQQSNFNINAVENVFFLFLILQKDADGSLSLLSYLNNQNNPVSQKCLQQKYKEILNEHFTVKLKNSNDKAKEQISEKERVVNYMWKNIESYSEHLITCRLAWLNQLGLATISSSRKTTYEISEKGNILIQSLKNFTGNEADINTFFLQTKFFKMLGSVYNYSNLLEKKSNLILTESLDIISNEIFPSNKFKFPYFETILFITMNSFLRYKTRYEFKDVEDMLIEGVFSDKYKYTLKLEARMNESYILKTIA